MTQPAVAAVIVTFESAPVLDECLSAVVDRAAEVIVVDNASRDTSCAVAKRYPVRLIANATNRGFAAAVNQGIAATEAPLILLLNPDAVLETGLDHLQELCLRRGIAAAAGQLLNRNGTLQKGFNVRRLPTPAALIFENLLLNRLWTRNPVNWRFRCLDFDLTRPGLVEQPAGAFLMLRRDAWEKLNGLDEGYYPLWFEDVDFCKRMRDGGFSIGFTPQARARHAGASSIKTLSRECRIEYWYRGLLRYSIRHFGPAGRVLTAISVILGLALRAVMVSREARSPATRRAYRTIARLAFRSLWMRRVQFGEVLS